MTLGNSARGPVVALMGLATAWLATPEEVNPNFTAQVRPILQKCLPCHGPDDQGRMANLRLDTRRSALGSDGGYPGLIPGNSAESRVMVRVQSDQNPMPPTGLRLTRQEIETLRRWIDAGARYERHWAFEPPGRPFPPAVAAGEWVRNPIDRFVLARLEREDLPPSPEAGRHTLIRRLTLDLTGLPPSPEETDAFVQDDRPGAYENLVNRLLASPAFGERWARVWLDLARYADSMGYEKDSLRPIWPYRDWVIGALNQNLPFDRFTVLQLAGDLLSAPSRDDLVATGFHRNTMTNTEGGTDDEEFRDAAVKDRVATTGQVWMGLTWGCAQCHTHKYDPVSHEEYYALYAFLNQTADADRNDDSPTIEIAEGVLTPILAELPADEQRETFIHRRGNFMNRGERVGPATPAAFHAFPAGRPLNRLGLATWLVSEENPLTARVAVNRIWARVFGTGIVSTEEDFGTQGSLPTHPQLLDWLATEFVHSDWDVKAIIRTVVVSATYRQGSDTSAQLLERDPHNTMLARGPRFRLPAEMVRDQALAASGLLSRKVGGPPVMPWQPDGIWQVVYSSRRWETSAGEDRYRRALYTLWRRTSPYPSMLTFDAPSGETCTIRRIRTNTPLQALVTLNDPTLMEAAEHLAGRAVLEAGRADEPVLDRMFRLVLARGPTTAERRRLLELRNDAAKALSRSVPSAAKLANYHRVLYTLNRRQSLVDDHRGAPPLWRYTPKKPPRGWQDAAFDDSNWNEGRGPFGHLKSESSGPDTDESRIRSPWSAPELWMRRTFDADSSDLGEFRLEVRHSGGFEAYVNGVLAARNMDGSGTYSPYLLSGATLRAVRATGNVLAVRAVHTGLSDASRNIDVGLTALRPPEFDIHGREAVDRAAWVVVANVILNLDETLTRR